MKNNQKIGLVNTIVHLISLLLVIVFASVQVAHANLTHFGDMTDSSHKAVDALGIVSALLVLATAGFWVYQKLEEIKGNAGLMAFVVAIVLLVILSIAGFSYELDGINGNLTANQGKNWLDVIKGLQGTAIALTVLVFLGTVIAVVKNK